MIVTCDRGWVTDKNISITKAARLPATNSANWLLRVFSLIPEGMVAPLDSVPSSPIRNVPYTATSRGGPVEEDGDECAGTSTSRGTGEE